MDDFYKTKITMEVEVSTQFGPESAILMVKELLRFPAIESIKVVQIKTNFRLHKSPGEEMVDFNM